MDASIAKIRALRSVSANILMKSEILNQRFEVSGLYRKAPGNRVALQLSVKGLNDNTGTMSQVCDGAVLWDFQQVLEDRSYTKVKIDKILTRLEDPSLDTENRDFLRSQLGFSGPEALLVGLRKTFRFDQLEEATFNGVDVWIFRGSWKDRAVLNAPDQPPLPAVGPLPAFIPSVAAVWVGKADGWPYQLKLDGKIPSILARADTRKIGPDGKPIGARIASNDVQPSHFLLSYSNVKINYPWEQNLADFAFQPPRSDESLGLVRDATEDYAANIDRYIQSLAQRKAMQAPAKDATPGQPAGAGKSAPSAVIPGSGNNRP